jgi:hypothetical protein
MAQGKLTAVYMKVPEGYVAFVEGLPGANTEGETLARRGRTWRKPSRWYWMQIVNCRSGHCGALMLFVRLCPSGGVKRADLIR